LTTGTLSRDELQAFCRLVFLSIQHGICRQWHTANDKAHERWYYIRSTSPMSTYCWSNI